MSEETKKQGKRMIWFGLFCIFIAAMNFFFIGQSFAKRYHGKFEWLISFLKNPVVWYSTVGLVFTTGIVITILGIYWRRKK